MSTALAVYYREKNYRVVFWGSQGPEAVSVPEAEIENFVKEKRPGRVLLMVAKPGVALRRLQFPFSQKQKIDLVLKAEMEDLLPKSPEEFVYHWYFVTRNRKQSEVMVSALDRTFYEFWTRLQKTHRFRLLFSVDSLVLFELLSAGLTEQDYFCLLAEEEYLLLNQVGKGVLVNSYSYTFHRPEESRSFAPMMNAILSEKNQPLYWYGKEEIVSALGLTGTELTWPVTTGEVAGPYLLPFSWLMNPGALGSMKFRGLGEPRAVSRQDLLAAAVCLLLVVFLLSPYFQIPAANRRVNTLKTGMNQLLREACPEVTRVVDPLTQMREKMKSNTLERANFPERVSILKTMADFVRAVPADVKVEVTHFIITGKLLFVSGAAEDLKCVEKLRVGLEDSGKFLSVKVGDLSFDAQQRVSFNLNLEIP